MKYFSSAHLAKLSTVKDQMVGFEMRLVDTTSKKTSFLHAPIASAKINVELEVEEPNGVEIEVQMNDEGKIKKIIKNKKINK